MSDNNQVLRLLGTIREECAEIRSRQEELYELLISYKDQLHDLKQTVHEQLRGLPKSPYIAGQLVPRPEQTEGVDDLRQLLATYLHAHPDAFPDPLDNGGPTDAGYEPPAEVDPESIKLEAGEAVKPKRSRKGGGGGGKRTRDNDLERGPDRDIEPIDLDDDDDEGDRKSGGKKKRRRRRRGGSRKKEAVESSDDD